MQTVLSVKFYWLFLLYSLLLYYKVLNWCTLNKNWENMVRNKAMKSVFAILVLVSRNFKIFIQHKM